MNDIRTRARLGVTAMTLLGLPLLAAVPSLAFAQDADFNPPPCDYSDQFYRDNGIDPTQVVGRFGNARRTGPPATGEQVNWVADTNCSVNDPNRRNIRILATTGGFPDDGTGS